jgi:hypothetical protein
MDGLIHKRGRDIDAMPFVSLREVADFTEELEGIVKEAAAEPPRKVGVALEYEQGKTGFLAAGDLRDALSDLAPLEDADRIYIASAFVDEDDPAAKADKSAFSASLYIRPRVDDFYGRLEVEGRKLTTVEGVLAAAKAAVDRHAAAKEKADKDTKREEEAERERQSEIAAAILKADADRAREHYGPRSRRIQEPQGGDPPQKPRPSRIKRFLYDPWTIGIGTVVIGGIAAALIAR